MDRRQRHQICESLAGDQQIKARAQELATRIDRPTALDAVCSFLENPANYR